MAFVAALLDHSLIYTSPMLARMITYAEFRAAQESEWQTKNYAAVPDLSSIYDALLSTPEEIRLLDKEVLLETMARLMRGMASEDGIGQVMRFYISVGYGRCLRESERSGPEPTASDMTFDKLLEQINARPPFIDLALEHQRAQSSILQAIGKRAEVATTADEIRELASAYNALPPVDGDDGRYDNGTGVIDYGADPDA